MDENLEAARSYVRELHAWHGSYHNHKETMAHAAMAAQVAFTVAVITWDRWPPTAWTGRDALLCLGVWVFSMSLYFYTGWEMVLRKWAAVMNKATERCGARLCEISRLEDYRGDGEAITIGTSCRRSSTMQRVLWWPWNLFGNRDREFNRYPKELRQEVSISCQEIDRRLVALEVMWFLVSIICLVVLLTTGAMGLWQDRKGQVVEVAAPTNVEYASLATLVATGVMAGAAFVTAYFARAQHRLDKNRVKIELYGRRLRIYKAVNAFIWEALATNQADTQRLARWYLGNRDAGFLFPRGAHITEYMNQLYENREKLRLLESRIQNDQTPDMERTKLVDQQAEVRKWFEDQGKRVDDRFRPYLQL